MALSLTLGACDSYLDINESPNPRQSAPDSRLDLPGRRNGFCKQL